MSEQAQHEDALARLLRRHVPEPPAPPAWLAGKIAATALAEPQRRLFWAEGWFDRWAAWPVATACAVALLIGVAAGALIEAPTAGQADSVAALWLDDEVP
jgi:hypothetical protein